MKKLLVFILIAIFISCTGFVKNSINPLFSVADKVCLIVDNGSLGYGEIINSGSVDFVYMTAEEGQKAINEVKTQGVEFYLSSMTAEEILSLLKADVVGESELQGLKLIYAYSPYYQDCILQNGKKVNVQIAAKDDLVVVGFPIILTGY